MIRKLIALAGALALVAVLAPRDAHAQEAGVIVFTGDAVVNSSAYNGAEGDGLCFPGLDPASNCQLDPSATIPVNGWDFSVPANPNAPLILCSATGVFGNDTVTGEGCEIDSDGDVGPNPAGVGPSCGMSAGVSQSQIHDRDGDGIGDDDDPIDDRDGSSTGEGPDEIVFPALGVSGSFDTGWITSAGGTLLLTGTYDFGTGINDFVGVVQARPLESGACGSTPAENFFVVGVTAGAAA